MKSPKIFRAVIFDFDGTLFYLNIDWQELKIRLQKQYPVPDVDWTTQPLFECLDRAPKTVKAKALALIDDLEYQGVVTGELALGTRKTLQSLKDQGKRIAIASFNGRAAIIAAFEKYDLPNPDIIIGRDDISQPKPHPESIELILKRLRLRPEECILVGDTVHDMEMGERTGIFCILLINPKLSHHPKDKAQLVIESLAELTNALLAENP